MLLLPLLLSNALAFPGALVAPDGARLLSDASVVVVSHTGLGTHLTIALHIRGDTKSFGLIIPVPEAVSPAEIAILDPDYLVQVELFSAPRIERIGCDDLSQITYYAIPPGCGSFDFEIDERTSALDPAEDALGLEVSFAENAYSVDIVTNLAEWMDQWGFVADAATDLMLAHYLDSGSHFVVAKGGISGGGEAWLEPVQIPMTTLDYRLPLALSASNVDSHDLTLLTFASGPLEPDLFKPAEIGTDCMVLGDFEGIHEANFEDALSPDDREMWVLEYSGLSSTCSPCAREPLEYYNLADFGIQGIEDAHVTRWRHRYDASVPAVDVHMVPGGPDSAQIRYIAYNGDLEFAYPVCGQGKISNPGVCPELKPDKLDGGCSSVGGIGWLWLLVLPVALRRRRVASLAVLTALSLGATDAHAESPRFDVLLDLPVWSTDRVLPDGQETGAPNLLNPFIGGEGRVGIATLKRTHVGITGGLRGFRGRGGGDVRFSFTEPHLGVDARHGHFEEGPLVIPLFRYGIRGSLGILDSAVFIPKATFGALIHIGAGAFIGRGPRRVVTELRASTVPRTDGYAISFHEVTGLPGWTYYPGTANLTLLVGVAFE